MITLKILTKIKIVYTLKNSLKLFLKILKLIQNKLPLKYTCLTLIIIKKENIYNNYNTSNYNNNKKNQ